MFLNTEDSLFSALENIEYITNQNVHGETFTIALSIITSLCLSTGCGLRVFTPFSF